MGLKAGQDPRVVHRPARVLIVDDERQNRQLLEIMLESEGFVFLTAAGGQEAIDLIAREPPDLILLDVMMPGMNGYQVAERIKGNLATNPIPIIMITALGDHNAMMKGLAAGAGDFLTKPVNRGELVLRIRNLLRLKVFGDNQHQYSQMLEGEVSWRTANLIESERLYRSTFDGAPIGIVHVGLDGEWLSANRRLCDLLGYSAKELRSIAIQDLIRSPTGTDEREHLRKMAAGTQDRQVVEKRPYLRKDGSLVWTRVKMSVHRDAELNAQHFILVIEDITERRTLEAEVQQGIVQLMASKERYRALLEGASDAIAVLTPEGVVREMNRRWVEIVGLPREQMIGRHLRDFARSDLGDVNAQMYDGVASSSTGARSAPVEFATPGGASVLLEFSHTIIDIADEQLVLTIGRDVTEQRQLEKQLLQAQKLEVIGQLAGGIAHDFNNLLTAILGSSEMLLMDVAADDPNRAEVVEIKKAGERAAGLTRQLLAFSRKQVLQPKVLAINDLITGMEPMLRRLIPAHVHLVIALQSEIGAVKMDPTQLEQIVVNLAINGADAMPGGGKLTIETANVKLDEHYRKHHLPVKPGDYIMLAVSDTGVGMDKETCRRVFEPFFTTKEVGKGTGLGLATVYGIVKQSGGDIWVYSEPGHGSAFKIYLPREARAAVPAGKVPAVAAAPPSGSETILLVEDDAAVRRLARLSLERSGYRVVEAENPKVALQLAQAFVGPIRLLLSDVVMPESDGPPLFPSLQRIFPQLRVLYISGYADEAVVRHGIVLDGIPFLQKPFTPLALSQKVRSVLDAPAPQPTAAPS